ncbi:hypothetical protein KPH14_003250 [Odynerus spinipes]|uniref:Uncharacterized protein n=1 Tax=Odynerus spinipes TaxID=1348599 RepID=A0AAD9RGP5_9HYME|nr:hypothetical protein KPH14_003250 [Odynerus spinipes]
MLYLLLAFSLFDGSLFINDNTKRVSFHFVSPIIARGENQRHRCWAKEAMEAERLDKMQKIENEENAAVNDLALAIQNRNRERADQANNFFDSLINKYAKKAAKTSTKKATKRKSSSEKPMKSAKKTKRKT